MKQSALMGSRYREVARIISEYKRRLHDINTRRDNAANEERKILRSNIRDLLMPHLTEQTVQRMRVALIAHKSLSRGERDPLLREVGLVNVFRKLAPGDIELLLNAYGDEGEYRKTPELERALTQLFGVCTRALKRRYALKRDEQLAECPTSIDAFRDQLDASLFVELQVFGIFTMRELSHYTAEQLRVLTCRPDDEIERAREVLDGIGLVLAE